MFDKINEIIRILRSQISQSWNIINISDNTLNYCTEFLKNIYHQRPSIEHSLLDTGSSLSTIFRSSSFSTYKFSQRPTHTAIKCSVFVFLPTLFSTSYYFQDTNCSVELQLFKAMVVMVGKGNYIYDCLPNLICIQTCYSWFRTECW